jgi:hypothetical protein
LISFEARKIPFGARNMPPILRSTIVDIIYYPLPMKTKSLKTRMVNFKVTEDQFTILQRAAEVYAYGNMSLLLRKWILGAKAEMELRDKVAPGPPRGELQRPMDR